MKKIKEMEHNYDEARNFNILAIQNAAGIDLRFCLDWMRRAVEVLESCKINTNDAEKIREIFALLKELEA